MSKKKNKNIWITWHYAVRSRNLAKELDLDIYELFVNKNIIARHLFSPIWTLWVLLKVKPDVVYIQLSFMLLNVVSLYKIFRFNKVTLIADCHTKALRRTVKGSLNKIFWPIKKAAFKKVDVSIVSNEGMIHDIEKLHNNYLILPDKIPSNKIDSNTGLNHPYYVYISSFAVDEPFDEIFEVARLIDKDITLYWTGRLPESIELPSDIPENLKFTGYTSFNEYYNLIGNADCVLAFTTEEDCLQSGAYEALDLNTPMILSDTLALRNFFGESATYTKIIPEEIVSTIKETMNNKEKIKTRMRDIRIQKDKKFNDLLKQLVSKVEESFKK